MAAEGDYEQSIFWIEVEKIRPNPYQPRREFDEVRLRDLAESIRQYGVLQPLVVTRQETPREDGGLSVEYELIAGERRWRASQLAGLMRVPAIIRSGEQTDKLKLEMAIIENLQREDLNAVERARAFQQLAGEFRLTHTEIAKKIGKSREYVSNTIRLLLLPEIALNALMKGEITEGHTRPILMLVDKPAEQETLFHDITRRRLTVREAERIARRVAFERARKQEDLDPELTEIEEKLMERLGARVVIERKRQGGKLVIEFMTASELKHILDLVGGPEESEPVEADVADVNTNNENKNNDSGDGEEDLYRVRDFTI